MAKCPTTSSVCGLMQVFKSFSKRKAAAPPEGITSLEGPIEGMKISRSKGEVAAADAANKAARQTRAKEKELKGQVSTSILHQSVLSCAAGAKKEREKECQMIRLVSWPVSGSSSIYTNVAVNDS